MSEVFLYTPDAGLQSSQLEALRRKGFIPVKTNSMDAVKIMAAPAPIRQATVDLILEAACATFSQFDSNGYVNGTFGKEIAKRVLAARATGEQP